MSLNLPSDGRIFVIATAEVVTFGEGTRLWFGLGTSPGVTNLHETAVGVIDGTDTKRRTYSVTSIATVVALAGSGRTLYVTAYKSPAYAAQAINLGHIYVTAIFIPN